MGETESGTPPMQHYLFRLDPPRPTFPVDMTPAEAALMEEHASYWGGQMGEGRVVAFGPVADPRGAYGIAILRLGDGADPNALALADPAVKANTGFTFEIHPMPQVVHP
jgi:uncharacterized protein